MAIDFVNGNASRYYSVDVTTPIVLPATGFSVGMWLNLPVGFNTIAAFQYFLSTGALNSANNINFFLGEATNFREIFARAKSGSSVSEDINNRFVNDVGVSPDGIEVVDHLLIFQGNGTEFELYWVEAETAVVGPQNTYPYLPSTGDYTLSTLELGNRTDHSSTRFYQNVMSEVFMLDRVLTHAEIENLATRKPITDEEPSPLLYLRCISPDATIADLSGNGHTATRVGTGYASYAHPIPLQGNYFRDFSGDADEDPFVDPEFTDVAATDKIVSGVLFPNTNAATKYSAGTRVGNLVKAKIQLSSDNSDVTDYVGAAVYNSSGEGYYAFVGNGYYYIGRTVGMSTNDIRTGSTPGYGPGSHLECWYDESTGLVSGYLNGVLLDSYTDSTYTGTFDAGFSFFPLGGNVSGITAFAAEGYSTDSTVSGTGAFVSGDSQLAGSGSVTGIITGSAAFVSGDSELNGVGSSYQIITGSAAFNSGDSTLNGSGNSYQLVSGVGAISVGNSQLNAVGLSYQIVSGEGVFSSADAQLSGLGSNYQLIIGEGSLVAGDSQIAGVGNSYQEISGAGSLNSDNSELSATISVYQTVTGAGAINSNDAELSGSGSVIGIVSISGNLAANDSGLSGVGGVRISAIGNFTSAGSQLDGSAISYQQVTGAGNLASNDSEINGAGSVYQQVTGIGNLSANDSQLNGEGVSIVIVSGIGNFLSQDSHLNGYSFPEPNTPSERTASANNLIPRIANATITGARRASALPR